MTNDVAPDQAVDAVSVEREYLAQAKAGKHITPAYSLHAAPKTPCTGRHQWRTIICVDDEDVEECAECGRQIVCKCSFDEEMS